MPKTIECRDDYYPKAILKGLLLFRCLLCGAHLEERHPMECSNCFTKHPKTEAFVKIKNGVHVLNG